MKVFTCKLISYSIILHTINFEKDHTRTLLKTKFWTMGLYVFILCDIKIILINTAFNIKYEDNFSKHYF